MHSRPSLPALTCAWCEGEALIFLRGALPVCWDHAQGLTFGVLRTMHMYADTLPTVLIAEVMLARR